MDERIIDNFLSLARIPRKSHHEEAVSLFLYHWAQEQGLSVCRDEMGNVIIDKPGTPGCENAPVTILQAHMDMVCVAEPGRAYDPLCDPIRVINDGVTLKADGTSLGGDDGIGVAIAMAILGDDAAVHGPIRAIFTVDEEDGMDGADALEARHLDAKYVINLDWESYGSLCCSSAGSDMYAFRRAVAREGTEGMSAFVLSARDFEGGHSGAQIHLGRANAIRVCAFVLAAAVKGGCPVRLASFKGGVAHNAIPAQAEALVVVPAELEETFMSACASQIDALAEGFALTDPGAVITLLSAELPEKAASAEDSVACLGLLTAIHDGVNTMSPSIPGLVESSSNIGLAALEDGEFGFTVHQRSSEPQRTAEMRAEFDRLAEEFGFIMEQLSSGPAWPVRPDSELVEICKRHFAVLNGREIRVEPVHAGLECGAFAAKNPALDIISIGPDILDIHSPRETLVLETVYKCDALVRSMLAEIAGQ